MILRRKYILDTKKTREQKKNIRQKRIRAAALHFDRPEALPKSLASVFYSFYSYQRLEFGFSINNYPR